MTLRVIKTIIATISTDGRFERFLSKHDSNAFFVALSNIKQYKGKLISCFFINYV